MGLHIAHAMRAYLLYLVDTAIFMNKSATYADVVYLRYFLDFERIHEYNWGRLFGLPVLEVEIGLYVEDEADHRQRHTIDGNNYWFFNVSLTFPFHLYKAITDNLYDPNFLFQAWILKHFLHISSWASVETYTEDISHATKFSLLKVN